jgi:hypothetical protein
MFSSILLVLGVIVLGAAFRTYHSPICQRLSVTCFVSASFLIGYLPTGSWYLGFAAVSLWFLLPWLEILTRIRRIRLPLDRSFREKTPPRTDLFPFLEDLTDEMEKEDFQLAEDVGYDSDVQEQFLRLFHRASDHVQASVCLVNQRELAFYYVSLTTRSRDGQLFVTWNYPFSYSLKFAPKTRVRRVRSTLTTRQMCEAHRSLLKRERIRDGDILPLNPEQFRDLLEQDLRAQIDHNVRSGLLKPAGTQLVRYTWRGMFYLWFQFLRDFLRL